MLQFIQNTQFSMCSNTALLLGVICLSTDALFIKKLQPNLNNQLGPDKGSRVSTNIFK